MHVPHRVVAIAPLLEFGFDEKHFYYVFYHRTRHMFSKRPNLVIVDKYKYRKSEKMKSHQNHKDKKKDKFLQNVLTVFLC